MNLVINFLIVMRNAGKQAQTNIKADEVHCI